MHQRFIARLIELAQSRRARQKVPLQSLCLGCGDLGMCSMVGVPWTSRFAKLCRPAATWSAPTIGVIDTDAEKKGTRGKGLYSSTDCSSADVHTTRAAGWTAAARCCHDSINARALHCCLGVFSHQDMLRQSTEGSAPTANGSLLGLRPCLHATKKRASAMLNGTQRAC
jgi:hypothetical protein